MEVKGIKQKIDSELDMITFTDKMRRKVMSNQKKSKANFVMRYAAAIMLAVLVGGTTVFAGYYFLNKVNVNDTTLPELDAMKIVEIAPITADTDEYGRVFEDFSDYAMLQRDLNVDLLDSELAVDQSYVQGNIQTDTKDYAIIKVENYIIGDTSNYEYLQDEGWYQFENGETYYSPVSLSVDLILSEAQFEQGFDTDYLGLYEYVESYTSEQGYKVNLIQDTIEEDVEGYVSEKCAVFVADGIRYTLRGRTSLETMKEIVDSMK
uniref:hypothetical protein n=1 Tax=Agathobacter sp. TaxID=2021311 RepID=UPI004055C82F